MGRTGQGKTTLAKRIIERLDKVFIVDVMNEYDYDNVYDIYDLLSVCNYVLKNNPSEFKYSLKITNDYFRDKGIEILWLFAKHYFNSYGCGFWLVCEEASQYAKNNSNHAVLNFVKYGRHYAINQIYITRNTTEINKTIIANSHLIITFNQFWEGHLKVLEEFNFDIEKVKNLKIGEFLASGEVDLLNNLLKTKKNKKVINNEIS